MKEQTLVQMADILPLPGNAPVLSDGTFLISLFALIVILSVASLLVFWRYYRMPVNRIYRQLQRRTISPRQALHELALNVQNVALREDLDKLRFRRQEVEPEQVMHLVRQVRRHAG